MKLAWLMARLVFTLAALSLAFGMFSSNLSDFLLKQVHMGWLLCSALLHLLILLVGAARLGLLHRATTSGPPIRLTKLTAINWSGFAVGQVALGTLGGDALRLVLLNRAGSGWRRSTILLIVDRFFGLAGLACVGFVAFWALTGFDLRFLAVLGLATAALLITTALVFRYARARFGRWPAFPHDLFSATGKAFALSVAPMALALALIGHALSISVFCSIGYAFGFAPPLLATVPAVAIGLFAAALPISLGGWGVRELTIAGSYVAFGQAYPQAVEVTVLFGLSQIAMAIPGLLALWMEPRIGR